MRKLIYICGLLLLLVACKEVSFKDPQPKGKNNLSEIPSTLCGTYTIPNDEGKIGDTLKVTSRGYAFGHAAADAAFLSDSLMLRHYKGYYFLNINKRPEWYLRVLKPEKNGDLNYLVMEPVTGSFSDYLERLSSEIEIDSISNANEKLYQIDPTPKQLTALISKGFFKSTILKKIK